MPPFFAWVFSLPTTKRLRISRWQSKHESHGCASGLAADADSLPVIAVVTRYLDALVEAVVAVAMVMAVVAAIVAGLQRCAGGQNCGSGKNRDC